MSMPKQVMTLLSSLRLSRAMLNLIFLSALLFLLIINFISYKQVNALIKSNEWVIHTQKVIEAIDTSLYTVVDIESRQRGYLIRGSDQFLVDMDTKKANLQKTLDELIFLTRDNPAQRQRVEYYIKVIDQRLMLLNQIMQLKGRNALDTPAGIEQLNASQAMSNQMKDLGHEMKAVETVLFLERNNLAVAAANTTNLVVIIGSIIGILFLIIAFIVTNIELATRKRTEKQNLMVQSRLRKIIESASDMIAAFDKDHRFIIFNETYQYEFKRLFDKSITVNMTLEEALQDIPANKQNLVFNWKESLKPSESVKRLEFMVDNEKNIYETSASLIQNNENESIGIVHSVRNITKRIQEHLELQHSYEQLAASMQELQDKNGQITLLVEMSDIMLACSSLEELSEVMSKYSQRLLNFGDGYLFIMHPSKNYLEKASSWGNPAPHDQTFTPDQCWAIRLGRLHQVHVASEELVCSHVKNVTDHSLLCVPLMAQNDIYGLLYVEIKENNSRLDENTRLLLTAFAELTALSLANVRLRENLRHQSIRDPLTSLYNRRYLEDFLFKQMLQAERTKAPFALLMLDLDHFKKINDNYGHEAGDTILKEFGHILQEDIRLGDLAARYGGEEFIVIFYDIDPETAKIRAEAIRAAVSKLQLKYGAQTVGQVTVSIGVAMYPKDAKTSPELIEAADKALYHAKNAGRNQVVLFGTI